VRERERGWEREREKKREREREENHKTYQRVKRHGKEWFCVIRVACCRPTPR
jgi:hypothetical protein